MEIKINTKLYSDKEICQDLLFSQELLTIGYAELISSCASEGLHEDVLALLCEEAKLHGEIYNEMKKRSFLSSLDAKTEFIEEIKAQYQQK